LRTFLTSLLKFLISFAILTYLIRQAIADEQFSALMATKKNWKLLSLGFLCSFCAIVTSILRWRSLVVALHLPLSLSDALRIGLMGQFFNLVAFGTLGADAMRAYFLSQKFRNRKSEAIVTVIADRFTGLLTMLFLGSVAFFVLERYDLIEVEPKYQLAISRTGKLVSLVAVVFTTTLALLILSPRLERYPLFNRFHRIPRLAPLFRRLLGIISIYRHRTRLFFFSFLMSVIVNMFFLLAIYFIGQGISPESPSLISHTFIEPIAMVCNALPLPGGLGGMEFALSILYRALGSQSGIVVAFTYRLSLLVVATIGGVLWFLHRKQMAVLPPEGMPSSLQSLQGGERIKEA
jgi:glycosyltransferase 2 family protein